MRADPDKRSTSTASAWYRQGIVWLGIGVFAASIAGCIWIIVVASRHADPPLPHHGLKVLDMPLAHPSSRVAPKPAPPPSPPASP
ncbi:MAG: hypothetical protein JSR34_12070 [Proteobacteria bacterium]|nr:hypothetical protein [Pseudomonadota bacterium]